MYEIYDVTNQKWDEIINRFPTKDIYFTRAFFKSAIYLDPGEPKLFYYQDANGSIAYTFILRKIKTEISESFYDVTTPYGYGGPLIQVDKSEVELLDGFRKHFSLFCEKNNIVSEFIRFHPLLQNHHNWEDIETTHIRDTIYMNLKKDDIWKEIPSKTRNMIRKANKNELKVEKIDKNEYLQEFLSIYESTMKRNNASDYYYFEKDYFNDIFEKFGSKIHMFGAFVEGRMVSSSLIFSYGPFMHYYLSGGLREYMSLGGNNVLLYEIAEWGKNHGAEIFYLGGGYSSANDNLFKFKKSFSKEDPLDFFIGKKIHNKSMYSKLVKEKDIKEENDFFPLYRSEDIH